MSTTINCSKCGHQLEITEALKAELEKKVLAETQQKHQEELEKIKQEQNTLLKKKEADFVKEKEVMLITARDDAEKKVKHDFDRRLSTIKAEAEDREKQNQELQKQLLDSMQQLREARDAEGKLKIEYEKKLLAEQDKLKADAKKEAQEELHLKIAEKDKKLSDAEKQIHELQRKIQQGSQQLQGEVFELELEEILRKEFPFDEIKEVPKGIRGADVIQIVKTRAGAVCGTIVWESKNTKNWSPSWVQKLVEDQRTLKAELAVLVTSVLPDDINSFGFQDKVWISNMKSAIALGHSLRHQLVGVQNAYLANKGKATKAEVVYDYLISNEFRQRIEVWVDYFKDRQEDMDREKRYYMKKWAKEEKSIMKVLQNTAGIYGDLQGLIGSALPKVQYLELPPVDEENE
jgi:hypothetical protein